MSKQTIITHGARHWTGKTRAAAEQKRDSDLNRLYADLDWEPIVIVMPHGVMVGFLNWAGNWEYNVLWQHQTAAEQRTRGCTILPDRSRHQAKVQMHRHAAQYVQDKDGDEAGLSFILESDEAGRETYLQDRVWQRAYREALAESGDESGAQVIADRAREEFAERSDRLPIRQQAVALSMLASGQPVPVTRAVWEQCEAHEPLSLRASQYLVLREEGQTLWCHRPKFDGGVAWLNQSGVAGYLDEHDRLCLLQLKESDEVVIAPKGKATYQALAVGAKALDD